MEKQNSNENKNLKERIRKVEIENQKLRQNHQKLARKIEKLENIRGTSDITEFEINQEEEWKVVERNLHKTGVLLEYEVAEYLKETNLEFDLNYLFKYPSDPGVFYIDYFFDKYS